MTGNDLRQIMDKCGLRGVDVARISGVSRAYISQVLDAPEQALPHSTVRKLRRGFLRYHQDVAASYFTIEGEFANGGEAA